MIQTLVTNLLKDRSARKYRVVDLGNKKLSKVCTQFQAAQELLISAGVTDRCKQRNHFRCVWSGFEPCEDQGRSILQVQTVNEDKLKRLVHILKEVATRHLPGHLLIDHCGCR